MFSAEIADTGRGHIGRVWWSQDLNSSLILKPLSKLPHGIASKTKKQKTTETGAIRQYGLEHLAYYPLKS